MLVNGHTEFIAHLGWPTHSFKAPMIYNPYFESAGVNALVVPMGCKPENFAPVLRSLFTLENIRGALITMPHKVSVVDLCDEVTPTVAARAVLAAESLAIHAAHAVPDPRTINTPTAPATAESRTRAARWRACGSRVSDRRVM